MTRLPTTESEYVRTLADKWRREGYDVVLEPRPSLIPFDLGGYGPDLLAERDGERYLVEVKTNASRLTLDRFQNVVAEVSRHPGWHFVLITPDDAEDQKLVPPASDVMSLPAVRAQISGARQLLTNNAPEAAIVAYWAALEGLLRRQAMAARLPAERLPSSLLLKHLYSHGELSMEQYDALTSLMRVRNQVAHGFRAPEAGAAAMRLGSLVDNIVEEWYPSRTAA